jgi:hypothetical protein
VTPALSTATVSTAGLLPIADVPLRYRLATLCHTVTAGDPTLFAYWRFDDGNGTVAIDEEGHYSGTFGAWTTEPLWVPSSAF